MAGPKRIAPVFAICITESQRKRDMIYLEALALMDLALDQSELKY